MRIAVFDLDGLIDSRGDIVAAMNHALARSGRKPLPGQVIVRHLGDGARVLCARSAGLPEGSEDVERLLEAFLGYYVEHPMAIESTGMEPVCFVITVPHPSDLAHINELLDGVKSCDIFLGLYDQTLDSNWTPEGYSKHSMELEQETAESIGLRCLYYVKPLNIQCDHDMTRFRQQIIQKGVEFLTTPDEIYQSLFAQLSTS